MTENNNQDISRSDILIRGLFMLLFYIAGRMTLWVVYLLSFVQFIFQIVTKKTNQQIMNFTQSINTYLHQTADFLTYDTEEKPWPFSEWPSK